MCITRPSKRMILIPSYWGTIGSGSRGTRIVGALDDMLWEARYLTIGMVLVFSWVMCFFDGCLGLIHQDLSSSITSMETYLTRLSQQITHWPHPTVCIFGVSIFFV